MVGSPSSPQLPNSTSSTSGGAGLLLGERLQGSNLSSRVSTVSETAVLIRQQGQSGGSSTRELDALYSRISWRLMTLFMAVMILNHVDRTNLAYASITMTADLNFGPATYGLGSALFFIPFCIFQIPSNLVAARLGVRRWLAFLIFGWGIVAASMAAVHNVASFFALRLLLGAFEAGAVPAIWFHLAHFYPSERITEPFALLTIGVLIAQAVSGPVAAAFLAMHGLAGLHGWQWLFLLEGLPTVLLSVLVWCYLPDSLGSVAWLTESEKKILESDLALAARQPSIHNWRQSQQLAADPEQQQQHQEQHRSHQQHLEHHGALRLLWTALCNPWLMTLCAMGLLLTSASNTYVFFLPMMINAVLQGGGLKPSPTPLAGHATSVKLLPIILTCIPYTLAALTSWFVAHSSQRRKEQYFHAAVPAIIGGVFFVLFPFLSRASVPAGFAALVLVAVSGATSIGPKTAIVHMVSAGPSQVVGMPMYNSIIVLGGFVGPLVTGNVVQKTGSFAAISVVFGVLLVLLGSALIGFKYALQRAEKRHAEQQGLSEWGRSGAAGAAATAAGCSTDAAAAAAVTASGASLHSRTTPSSHAAAGSCPADGDAAASADSGSLEAVVVLSGQNTPVRPHAAACQSQRKQ